MILISIIKYNMPKFYFILCEIIRAQYGVTKYLLNYLWRSKWKIIIAIRSNLCFNGENLFKRAS